MTLFVGERKIQQDGRKVSARSVRNPGRSLRGGADKKQASDGARFQGQRDWTSPTETVGAQSWHCVHS